MASSSLSEYKRKRKFDKTPEPGPKKKRTRTGHMFVIQKHRATQLHYDFRLEVDGVLKSWAVPKGPIGRLSLVQKRNVHAPGTCSSSRNTARRSCTTTFVWKSMAC